MRSIFFLVIIILSCGNFQYANAGQSGVDIASSVATYERIVGFCGYQINPKYYEFLVCVRRLVSDEEWKRGHAQAWETFDRLSKVPEACRLMFKGIYDNIDKAISNNASCR
jgi:hypothetical protein